MRHNHPSVAMIEVVAKALGDLNERVVFVGGSTVPLYLENVGSQAPRPTEDVDCVIELASYTSYAELEKQLRARGFRNSDRNNAPICRWEVNGVVVDIMPTDERVIGFSNKWYSDGIKHAMQVTLPSGMAVRIFSPPFFIASKFEAFLGRGHGDFSTSHDIEDVVTLLDGLLTLSSIETAPLSVREYIQEKLDEFLASDLFRESIAGHLEPGPTQAEATRRILSNLNQISKGFTS